MADAATSLTLHGTAIALDGRAILIRGASGTGKSDLALRCLALPPSGLIPVSPRLVADDQVHLAPRNGRLMVSPPAPIAGLMEVRGVGILRFPYDAEAELALVADIARPEDIERLPEQIQPFECLGLSVPRRLIAPREPSAALKLVLMLAASIDGNAAMPHTG